MTSLVLQLCPVVLKDRPDLETSRDVVLVLRIVVYKARPDSLGSAFRVASE